MATLTPRLILESEYDSVGTTTGTTLISVDDTLSVTSPATNLASKLVATGSASELIASNSAHSYIYIKAVSGENATDFLQVKIGSHAVIRLDIGQFMFTPIYNGYAINTESYGGAITVEFGSWTKS
tara:strand:+ start:338 stop:715 length:378 start_codon:yes stop_codon:yes gene_type:complete